MKKQQEHYGKAHLGCEINYQKTKQKAWVTASRQCESTASFSSQRPSQD